MDKRKERRRARRVRYWRKTWMNKVVAIALLAISLVPVVIYQEGTAFILMLFIAIPMFFAKDNWIVKS